MALAPPRLTDALNGLLGFPVTPFRDTGEVDLVRFEAHLSEMLDARPAALFVACGTGEFASLTLTEHRELVRAAVGLVDGAVPVIAGAGGGTQVAVEFTRSAQEAGADGVLVL